MTTAKPHARRLELVVGALILVALQSTTAAASPPGHPLRAKLTLKGGQALTGEVVSDDGMRVVLRLAEGATVTVASGGIVKRETEVDPADSRHWDPDPNRTRYIYAPSAMFLRPGEAYVSQKQLVLTTAALGVTDWFNVLVGSVLPAWGLGADGLNFMAGAKLGTSIGDHLFVNAGGELLYVPGDDGGWQRGFIFGGATVGTKNNHASLTVGIPSGFYRNNFFKFDAGEVILVLSASLRVSDSVGLVTENWIFPTTALPTQTMVNSIAARFIGGRYSFDFGIVRFLGYSYPVPWLDFTYTFEVPFLQRATSRP